jgi:hypothetical protein
MQPDPHIAKTTLLIIGYPVASYSVFILLITMSDPHTPTLMFRVAVPLFKRKQSKGVLVIL